MVYVTLNAITVLYLLKQVVNLDVIYGQRKKSDFTIRPILSPDTLGRPKGHFTHKTESPWPSHFKHSHWWKRWSRSKFASHYARRTNGVCECKMDVKSTWILTWHQMDHVSWSFGLFSKNHLLEVGLTQNWETMALWTLMIVGLF
jgi:hypothetical protein